MPKTVLKSKRQRIEEKEMDEEGEEDDDEEVYVQSESEGN